MQHRQRLCRLAPRQLGYPSPFRGQVCRAHVPSHVSRRWFSSRGASLPSFGSRRARFPALSSTMKALRLPTRASAVAYWFASTDHAILLPSCLAYALLQERRSFAGPGLLVPAALLRFPTRGREWDLSGLQAIHPMPLLRSATPAGPRCPRHSRAPQCCPRHPHNEGPSDIHFGANPKLWHLLPTLHAWRCRTRARLASGRRAAPLPGGS